MNDDNNKNEDYMDKNVSRGSHPIQQESARKNNNSTVDGTDSSGVSNEPNSNNSKAKKGHSMAMGLALRSIDYESTEQPSAPRRGTSVNDADVDAHGSSADKLIVKELLVHKKSSSEDMRNSRHRHQYEKDAKNLSLYSASKPPSPRQPGLQPLAGSNNNDGLNAKQAMMMHRDPRLAQNKTNDKESGGGGNLAYVDEDVSVALSIPRVVRGSHETLTTPMDDELLRPTQRLIKVRPEAGCPLPGAYAARQSQTFVTDVLDTSNRSNSTPEGSQEANSSPGMRQSSSLHVEESFGSQVSGSVKSSHRKSWFLFAGIVLVLLVFGIGTGVGLAMSGNETAPSPPSCSLDNVVDECSGDALSNFQSDIPSCVTDQYQTLRNTFIDRFRIAAPEESSCTPENLALLSTALHTNETTADKTIFNRFGLSFLYFATGSSAVLKTEGWTSETPHCEWGARLRHIQCNNSGDADHVTSIRLGSSDLTGSIPSYLPLFLPFLHTLDVKDNSLTGTLPPELANLSHLSVATNALTGTISSAFTGSKTLIEFTVSENANLRLNRDQTFFSGTQLRSLDLTGIDFQTGAIPTELLLLTNLVDLGMGELELTGTVPNAIFSLTKLKNLLMHSNKLTGTLRSEFGDMLNLEQLDLSYNSFNGTIFSELGELTNIQELYVEYNSLTGTIPSELGRLTKLAYLSVLYNMLTGQMPTELGQLTSVETLFFGKNKLSGTIPPELCALRSLDNMTEFGSPPFGALGIDLGGLVCLDTMPECCEPMPS
jgi:Leucine-rich repeat (LRR) protein